jgi:hypothetical protein
MRITSPRVYHSKQCKINFDLEKPYIEIINASSNYTFEELQKLEIDIILVSKGYDEQIISTIKIELKHYSDMETGCLKLKKTVINVSKNTKELTAHYTCYSNKLKGFDEEPYIKLEYQIIDRIKSENQHTLFKNHLNQNDNIKIMFSAPFGHGKSTFLEYFFIEEANLYKVIKLTPINYSVASNEDIFKYIKSDIVTQLIGQDLDYDNNKSTSLSSLFQFSKDNLDRMLIPFLRIVPHIGKSVHAIVEDVIKLKNEYFEYHEKEKNDSDIDKTLSFIEKLYEQEGSIYEDNFYTQLIRQLLELLKIKTKKQSVLIIDDLDRMDPEHIFRILNILSVHFDSFNLGEIEIHNKFGFDKIILVCDYENIRKIYEHKYGKGVDFGGYINKYYSKKVYDFNYSDEVNQLLENIDNVSLLDNDIYSAFFNLTEAMFKSNLLSLRDIYKIRSQGLQNIHDTLSNSMKHNDLFCYGLYSPTVAMLSNVLGYSVFKSKTESMDTTFILNSKISLQYSCLQLMGALQGFNNKKKEYNLDDDIHSFFVYPSNNELEINTDNYQIQNNKNINQQLEEFKWNNQHLKTLLLQNIEKYQSLKKNF